MYSVTATFSESQAKVDDIYPIDFYAINASLTGYDMIYYADVNQDTIGYGVSSEGNMTATTVTYIGLPIARNAVQNNISGEIPGIEISIPNTDRTIEALLHSYNYLRGCEIYIILYFADNLPSGNTASYIGTDPDRLSCVKEKFYIDSCTSNAQTVTLNAKSKFNIQNIVVPRRTYARECHWALTDNYLGDECLGTGSISAIDFPTCDGSLDSCRKRNNEARFGGFPSVPKKGLVIL